MNPPLAVVVDPYLLHDALPLVDKPRSLEAALAPLEVGERGVVVLTLLRVDDAHALRAPQARSDIGRLGGVVAQVFECVVSSSAHEVGETLQLLGLEEQ